MQEIKNDIWNFLTNPETDAICITTNGIVKKNGDLVMGKGIALEAKLKFPALPQIFGNKIKLLGHKLHYTSTLYNNLKPLFLIAFPTKFHYKDPSDINLIKKSCQELIEFCDTMKLKKIYLPRPGCGNGGLDWNNVKKELSSLLDDRFIIVSN